MLNVFIFVSQFCVCIGMLLYNQKEKASEQVLKLEVCQQQSAADSLLSTLFLCIIYQSIMAYLSNSQLAVRSVSCMPR